MASYTYTVEDIIDAAVERNQMNDRTKLAGNAELILVCSRKQQKIFLDAAKINPEYFGKSATINLDGSYQADLTTISPAPALISYCEIASAGTGQWDSGDEVNLTTYADLANEAIPRMYMIKDTLVGDSALTGVTSVSIKYSELPAVLDATASPSGVTLSLPDEHADYLISEMAYYLAMKDNRSAGELQLLKEEIAEARTNVLTTAAMILGNKGKHFA